MDALTQAAEASEKQIADLTAAINGRDKQLLTKDRLLNQLERQRNNSLNDVAVTGANLDDMAQQKAEVDQKYNLLMLQGQADRERIKALEKEVEDLKPKDAPAAEAPAAPTSDAANDVPEVTPATGTEG